MPSKVPRERMLIIAVLVCLGALVFDQILVEPLIKHWSASEKRIAELKQNVEKGDQLLKRENALTTRWNAMVKESQTADVSAVEYDLLNAVNNWAGSSRLTVTSLRPRWITEEEGCKKLEIRVSSTGTMESIARFLYELEIDSQPLKVEDVELSTKDDKSTTLNCDVRLTRLVLEEGKR